MAKIKKKTAQQYERELQSMIESRTGKECEAWLLFQIWATAANMEMIGRVHENLMTEKLTVMTAGSMGQMKKEPNPLLSYYLKLQAELRLQLQALGLNYNATPSKINENTKKGGEEHDKLSSLLEDLKQ